MCSLPVLRHPPHAVLVSFFFLALAYLRRGNGPGRRRRRGREGTPDPLIARHSCPFVRHLIASRGSRGILRGGYLCPSLFLSRALLLIQLHEARLGVRYTFRGHRCPSICPLQNLRVSNVADQSCLATLSFFRGFRDRTFAVDILRRMFFARHVVLLPESL